MKLSNKKSIATRTLNKVRYNQGVGTLGFTRVHYLPKTLRLNAHVHYDKFDDQLTLMHLCDILGDMSDTEYKDWIINHLDGWR